MSMLPPLKQSSSPQQAGFHSRLNSEEKSHTRGISDVPSFISAHSTEKVSNDGFSICSYCAGIKNAIFDFFSSLISEIRHIFDPRPFFIQRSDDYIQRHIKPTQFNIKTVRAVTFIKINDRIVTYYHNFLDHKSIPAFKRSISDKFKDALYKQKLTKNPKLSVITILIDLIDNKLNIRCYRNHVFLISGIRSLWSPSIEEHDAPRFDGLSYEQSGVEIATLMDLTPQEIASFEESPEIDPVIFLQCIFNPEFDSFLQLS